VGVILSGAGRDGARGLPGHPRRRGHSPSSRIPRRPCPPTWRRPPSRRCYRLSGAAGGRGTHDPGCCGSTPRNTQLEAQGSRETEEEGAQRPDGSAWGRGGTGLAAGSS
jgi:hypothetical protein